MSEDTGWLNAPAVADLAGAAPQTVASPARARQSRLAEWLLPFVRSRADWLVAGLLGGLVFLNYLWTLAPTIMGEDSGRWEARIPLLGTGHPTGYPTFIMLGKLFTYLPVGDIAYRVNLASAVYGALAVALLYFVCRRLTGAVPAVLACLAFAVSRTYWSQAVVAEVYTLHVLFLCAILLTLLVWKDTRNDRYLLLSAFLIGLAMTNHMTSGLLIPCAALLVLVVDRRKLLDWKLAGKAGLLLLLGLTPYLYLPIRASMSPPMSYGNPSSLSNFLYVVTGGPFRQLMWAFGPSELPKREAMYWVDLRQQFSIFLLAISVAGCLWAFKRPSSRNAAILLGTLFAANLLYALEYNIWDIFVYFIPTHLIISVFLACGIQRLFEASQRLGGRPTARAFASAAVPVGVLLLVGYGWWTRYDTVDQSHNYKTKEQMEAIASAPPDSIIYDTNSTGMTRYLQLVERRRLDLWIRQVERPDLIDTLEQDSTSGRKMYVLSYRLKDLLGDKYALYAESGLYRILRNEPVELLTANANLVEASEWLKANPTDGGSLVTSPYVDEALRRLGVRADMLPAVTEEQLNDPSIAYSGRLEAAQDVRWLYQRSVSKKSLRILDSYDVRYLVLMKRYPRTLPTATRNDALVRTGRYKSHPEKYEVAFENDQVVIFRVLR